jgi:hypothetical protein
VVEREARRVLRQVVNRRPAAVDDPVEVELELDVLGIGLLEQDVVRRPAVEPVGELEFVVVVEELEAELLLGDLAGRVEVLGELMPQRLLVVGARPPREAGPLLADRDRVRQRDLAVLLLPAPGAAGKLGPSWPENARIPLRSMIPRSSRAERS